MDNYCQDKGFIGWFETSAKDNVNIDQACRALVAKILENDVSSVKEEPKDTVNPAENGAPRDSGCSC